MASNVVPFRKRAEKHEPIPHLVLVNGLQAMVDVSGVALFYQIENDTAPCEYSAPLDDPA